MGKNLFDYSKVKNIHTDIPKNLDETLQNVDVNAIDNDTMKQASDIYEKYKDYSTQDLKEEFLSLSKKRLKDGSLTKEKLSSTLSSLTPFLSSSQKDFISNLLGELDD